MSSLKTRQMSHTGVLRPPVPLRTLPAVPILAIWRQQAVDMQRSIMTGEYGARCGYKSTATPDGRPLLSFRYSHTHFLSTLLLTYIPTSRINASLATPRLSPFHL